MNSHILIVDDDDRLRELLKKYLLKNDFAVSSVSSAREADKLIKKYIFDVLIVDYMMPNENGAEFARRLRDGGNFTSLIMLTALGGVENKIEGLTAGADDYVCKPFEPRELVLRINNLIKRTRGKKDADENLFYFGNYAFNFEKKELLRNGGELVKLTDVETGLLDIFIKNANQVLSREMVCELTKNRSERTLDVQIIRLRKKIEENFKNPRLLKTVRNRGYIFNV
ncbi:MAG: response regulator transcription factor [Rickettsiales bacterium]|jgi:two-component system phosphate regulon response regulator OmpR|nr:response regulator transcription factor [Rickettsiales bacterium]